MADIELMQQVETVGRWEDENQVPEDDRLTRRFTGWTVHTVLMGVEISQIRLRYQQILQEA